ncbi:hypothetical protein [Teredinibacter haidensis]|uniref:hypothetical protein n=1 Tax=Teredinibacter haidensis TaxID=2731755 RepID=UPI0009489313|nr:hypothetical protein [Teredinibacter haidensis]
MANGHKGPPLLSVFNQLTQVLTLSEEERCNLWRATNSVPSIIEQHTNIKLSNKEFDNLASYFEKVKDIEIPDDIIKYRDDNN